MKVDVASLKMEYDAERDRFLNVLFRLQALPDGLPPALRATYLEGYGRGLVKSLQFDPVDDVGPPVELDWEFEGAWKLGYKSGCFFGQSTRDSILTRLFADRGWKSPLFGRPVKDLPHSRTRRRL